MWPAGDMELWKADLKGTLEYEWPNEVDKVIHAEVDEASLCLNASTSEANHVQDESDDLAGT